MLARSVFFIEANAQRKPGMEADIMRLANMTCERKICCWARDMTKARRYRRISPMAVSNSLHRTVMHFHHSS